MLRAFLSLPKRHAFSPPFGGSHGGPSRIRPTGFPAASADLREALFPNNEYPISNIPSHFSRSFAVQKSSSSTSTPLRVSLAALARCLRLC